MFGTSPTASSPARRSLNIRKSPTSPPVGMGMSVAPASAPTVIPYNTPASAFGASPASSASSGSDTRGLSPLWGSSAGSSPASSLPASGFGSPVNSVASPGAPATTSPAIMPVSPRTASASGSQFGAPASQQPASPRSTMIPSPRTVSTTTSVPVQLPIPIQTTVVSPGTQSAVPASPRSTTIPSPRTVSTTSTQASAPNSTGVPVYSPRNLVLPASSTSGIAPVSVRTSPPSTINASPLTRPVMSAPLADTSARVVTSIPSPRSIMAADYGSAVRAAGVPEASVLQNQLLERGFLHDYTMFDGDQATYVVVTTLNGARAYVKIDTPTGNVIDANSRRTMTRTQQQLVPASMQVGADRCLSSSICSVAFECNNGVCVRAAPAEGGPVDAKYVNYQVSRPVVGAIQVAESQDVVRAYPVLPLSYIMNNAPDAVKTVEQEYHRLTKELTTITLSRSRDITKQWSDISKIAAEYSALVASFEGELNSIEADINKTEKFQEHWATVVRNQPSDTVATDKLRATHVVLVRYRNAHRDIMENLHHTNTIVDRVISDMSQLAQSIKAAQDTHNRLKSELKKDITLPASPVVSPQVVLSPRSSSLVN